MRTTTIFILFIVFTFSLFAQRSEQWSMAGLSVIRTYIGNPIDGLTGDYGQAFGGSLLYEVIRKQRPGYRFSHLYQGGYFYHPDVNQVFFASWKANIALELARVFRLHGLIGIGYAHSWPTHERFVRKGGEYQSTKTGGLPHVSPKVGLGISVGGQHVSHWEAFAHYETFSLAPYGGNSDVPFSIHGAWEVGLKRSLR